jgi:hypothetical protein
MLSPGIASHLGADIPTRIVNVNDADHYDILTCGKDAWNKVHSISHWHAHINDNPTSPFSFHDGSHLLHICVLSLPLPHPSLRLPQKLHKATLHLGGLLSANGYNLFSMCALGYCTLCSAHCAL